MTAPVRRVTLPSAVGENRKRIRNLEFAKSNIMLRPPSLMGNIQPVLANPVGSKQVRSRGGVAYRADLENPLVAGNGIRIDYFQDADAFDQLSVRAHLATGLDLQYYNPREPWESSPWNGGFYTSTTTLAPILGNWNGQFYCFVGICDSPGATVHFQSAGGSINSDETAGFDTPSGHIGYLFHNATVSDATNITVTATAGTVGESGYIRINRGSYTGTVDGAVVGSVDLANTRQASITLSADVPVGDCLLVMVASEDDNIQHPGDAASRPYVVEDNWFSEEVPEYFANGRWFPILAPSERLGTGATGTGGGTPVRTSGVSTSGTPGTTVMDLQASGSNKLVAWTLWASQDTAANTQFTVTVTYSDTTTSTVSTNANTPSTVQGNAGELYRFQSGAVTATASLVAKDVVRIKVTTLGTGTGGRYAGASALETA